MSANPNRREIFERERRWHEQEAHRRSSLNQLLYAPPAFDQIVQSGLSFLEVQPGERVLDIACGEGKETLELARRGLHVVAVDLSLTPIIQARKLVNDHHMGARVFFIQANAEEMPFVAHSFRVVHGKAILHHLNLGMASRELKRILRPNGRAVFSEPLHHHPLFRLARQLTPQLRTRDEHPLPLKELLDFAKTFPKWHTSVYFLLTPLAYGLRLLPGGEKLYRSAHLWLQHLDSWLFERIRFLRKFAWYGTAYVQVGEEREIG